MKLLLNLLPPKHKASRFDEVNSIVISDGVAVPHFTLSRCDTVTQNRHLLDADDIWLVDASASAKPVLRLTLLHLVAALKQAAPEAELHHPYGQEFDNDLLAILKRADSMLINRLGLIL